MRRETEISRRLSIERLERRELLCGGTAAGIAGFQSAARSALFARAPAFGGAISKSDSSTAGSATDEATETHLFATLTDNSGVVVGTAFYETEVHGASTTQVLAIQVVGGAPQATYDVTV